MICLLITFQSSLIHTENTAIFTWLSRHIWIQLHWLWSSYLEATGSYLRNCPDFEKKMTDPGQWSIVRCLETTRTASQAVAPPAGMPLLHLIIKNGKKKLFSKLGFTMNHQMLITLKLLDKKWEKKTTKVSITDGQMCLF